MAIAGILFVAEIGILYLTIYTWERAELQGAKKRYEDAVNRCKMHANSGSIRIYEAAAQKAYAELMTVTARYAGCK